VNHSFAGGNGAENFFRTRPIDFSIKVVDRSLLSLNKGFEH